MNVLLLPDRAPESRSTILFVAGDSEPVGRITDFLELRGVRVIRARTGAEAGALLAGSAPDLILLDLVLPDTDALLLCADLKAGSEVPVIVCACSTSGRRSDAAIALRLGADDFIGKPNAHEFAARVERVLSGSRRRPASEPAAPSKAQRIGDLIIDHARRNVTLGGQPVHTTPTEYRILVALAERLNEVLARDELAEYLWGSRDAISARAIDVHVRRLRAKLSSYPTPPPPIMAARGFGYRLVGDAPMRSVS